MSPNLKGKVAVNLKPWVAVLLIITIGIVITVLAVTSIINTTHLKLSNANHEYGPYNAVINYTLPLALFNSSINNLIIVVGPRTMESLVYGQALQLGLGDRVIMIEPSQLLTILKNHPGSIVIIDQTYATNYTLLAMASRYALITINGSMLNVENDVIKSEIEWANLNHIHGLFAIPIVVRLPFAFTVEGFTTIEGHPVTFIGNLTLQGLIYEWYEITKDQPGDPCAALSENPNELPGYYEVNEFSNALVPYSDDYTYLYIYDTCIWSSSRIAGPSEPTPTNPDRVWFDPFAYAFMESQSYSVQGSLYTVWSVWNVGLAIDSTVGKPYITYWGYSYPGSTSSSGSTSFDIYALDAITNAIEFILEVLEDVPVQITHGLNMLGIQANDTWVFAPTSVTQWVNASSDDSLIYNIASLSQEKAYLNIDENYTIYEGVAYSTESCEYYYTYVTQIQWEIIYTLNGTLPLNATVQQQPVIQGPSEVYSCQYISPDALT